MEYKVISLFSGAGGSSEGYKQAGLKVIAAVEFINYQAHNYRLNHKGKVYEKDIRLLDPLDVLKDMGLKSRELDVLDGSPPCSSFSTAGAREKNWGKKNKYSNTEQRTDDLFLEYIRFLRIIKPKVFVAENVSGLIKGTAKGKFNEFLKLFKESGYNVKCKLLNAMYYNVPQSRQRVIFIGVRNDYSIEPCYPIPSNNVITAAIAINGVISKTQYPTDFTKNFIELWDNLKIGEDGQKFKGKGRYFNIRKLHPNKPATTVCKKIGSGLMHWEEKRFFTIEECKRLCSFPDDYKLEGTYAQQWEAMGRAVPPNMMKAIAENIKTNILDKIYNQ